MTNRPGLDFSFSGLKTQAVNSMKQNQNDQARADIAYAFQEAVVDTLAIKCQRALHETGLQRLVVSGGVSANTLLRERLREMTHELGAQVYYPRLEFCTDNGAMIAYAGYQRLRAGQAEPLTFFATPRWSMNDLAPP